MTVNCPSVEWHNCTFASLGINKSPVVIPLLKHYGFFIGIKKSQDNQNSVLGSTYKVSRIESYFLANVDIGKTALKIQSILTATKPNLTALNFRCF